MNGIYNIMAQRPGVFRFVLILFEEYRFQVISSPFELYMYQAVSARTQPQTSVVVRNNAINRFEQRAGWIAGGYFKKKAGFWVYHGNRSEEHTSELQSLMRISYAVFCLKTKK